MNPYDNNGNNGQNGFSNGGNGDNNQGNLGTLGNQNLYNNQLQNGANVQASNSNNVNQSSFGANSNGFSASNQSVENGNVFNSTVQNNTELNSLSTSQQGFFGVQNNVQSGNGVETAETENIGDSNPPLNGFGVQNNMLSGASPSSSSTATGSTVESNSSLSDITNMPQANVLQEVSKTEPNNEEVKTDKPRKSKFSIILAVLVLIMLGAGIVFAMSTLKNYTPQEHKAEGKKEEEPFADYIFKISFDYNGKNYIYLMKNNQINVVTAKNEKKTLEFRDESLEVAIDLLEDIKEQTPYTEEKLEDFEIADDERRVFIAMVTGNEDMIEIEDYISFETVEEELKNQNYISMIVNSKSTFTKSENNKLVNKMADYLNTVVDEEYKKTEETIKQIIKEKYDDLEESLEDVYSVEHELDLEYAGLNSISYSYVKEGELGELEWSDKRGYVFDYEGNIMVFPKDIKEESYKKALAEFTKTGEYMGAKDQLKEDWKAIAKEELFKTGAWYVDEQNIVFFLDGSKLGFEEENARIYELEIEVDRKF